MRIVAFECSPDIRDYSPALVTFYFLHCIRRRWMNQPGQKSCLILSQTRIASQGPPSQVSHLRTPRVLHSRQLNLSD